jgi:hypothetical protein
MAITYGVSPFIIFGSIFKPDPLRDKEFCSFSRLSAS